MLIKTDWQFKKWKLGVWLGLILVALGGVKYLFSPMRKITSAAKRFNSVGVVGGYC